MAEKVKNKTVGVVCSTYRNPDKESLVRLYGVVSLFDQISKQDYNGDIKMVLVDSSPEPYPFYNEIKETFKDSVIYLHVPERNAPPHESNFVPNDDLLVEAYRQDILERIEKNERVIEADLKIANKDFSLSEKEWDQVIQKTPAKEISDIQKNKFLMTWRKTNNKDVQFWKSRIQEMKAFAQLIPFEDDYPIQINIFSAMFQTRPTIGMAKNLGVEALERQFGKMAVYGSISVI